MQLMHYLLSIAIRLASSLQLAER